MVEAVYVPTQRDRLIVLDVARGFPTPRISEHRHLSEQSIKSRIRLMLQRTGTIDRTQLVIWFLRRGYITLELIFAEPFCPPGEGRSHRRLHD